jgi:hypothetical protein
VIDELRLMIDAPSRRAIPLLKGASPCPDNKVDSDESLTEAGLVKASRLRNLTEEGYAILSIVVASAKTARSSRSRVNRQSSIVNRR